MPNRNEIQEIRNRYDRRSHLSHLYDPTSPYVYMATRERILALIRLLRVAALQPVSRRTVLEIGCGSGSNLLQLILLGFRPENLTANELLDHRAQEARHNLPAAVRVITGDAAELDLSDASFDVVMQSTVFSSILDDSLQQKLASRMWSLVKPGGGVLWYDFVYDNPRNRDVRGVPMGRVKQLFPDGAVAFRRVTLAPPIGRPLSSITPCLYSLFNLFPFLRSHRLCWIGKAK
jgi:SAM-dependent methyltransferase